MISRQPGTMPRGTANRVAGDRVAADRVAVDAAAAGPGWLVRVLPLTLLIVLGLAGLRGAVTEPRWNGPWQRDGLAIGFALEFVLGILLVIMMRRRAAQAGGALAHAAPTDGAVISVAAKLRGVLIFGISMGMVAVAVIIIVGLNLHVFAAKRGSRPLPGPSPATPSSRPLPIGSQGSAFHIPAAALLYALLVVVLVAAIVLSIWWSRRFRTPGRIGANDFIAEDSEDLREAVESGRSALHALDDARAAIIACYLAMETHLAERGTARAIADTPDELLARAQATGLLRGTAAARLTALFYEARFSSHPLARSHRDAAARALDELAAALAQTDPAPAEGAAR